MPEGPQTFWDFLDLVDEEVERVIDDIVEKANWAAEQLEDAANGLLATLGRLIPGESEAEKAIEKWNTEIVPAIEQAISDIRTNIADAIADFFGEPLDLLDYSRQMIAAKEALYTQSTLAQDITTLGTTWSGPAYQSYQTVATEQSDALLALANNLQAGGQLVRDGAETIFSYWLEVVRDLHGYSADAIAIIGGFADVGKALGGWISAAADAVALIWRTLGDVALDLVEVWKDQITGASVNWQVISAGFDGLPQNRWPVISEGSSDAINDPANWPAA